MFTLNIQLPFPKFYGVIAGVAFSLKIRNLYQQSRDILALKILDLKKLHECMREEYVLFALQEI